MMKWFAALTLAAVANSAAQAETLFDYSWSKATKAEAFPPPAANATPPTIYMPNGKDEKIRTRPADSAYKVGMLSVASNPKFAADLFGVTSKLFTFSKASNYLAVWNGAFPLTANQNIQISLTYGLYAPLGFITARNGTLSVNLGGGKYQKFATYKAGKRHGFIWAVNTAKDGKVSFRVTFTNEGEGLQSSPWVPVEVSPKVLAEANYMSLLWSFPDSQKKGDASIFYLQDVGISSLFPKP